MQRMNNGQSRIDVEMMEQCRLHTQGKHKGRAAPDIVKASLIGLSPLQAEPLGKKCLGSGTKFMKIPHLSIECRGISGRGYEIIGGKIRDKGAACGQRKTISPVIPGKAGTKGIDTMLIKRCAKTLRIIMSSQLFETMVKKSHNTVLIIKPPDQRSTGIGLLGHHGFRVNEIQIVPLRCTLQLNSNIKTR